MNGFFRRRGEDSNGAVGWLTDEQLKRFGRLASVIERPPPDLPRILRFVSSAEQGFYRGGTFADLGVGKSLAADEHG